MATDLDTPDTTQRVPPERRRRPRTDRVAAALPGAILVIVFGFFFITKTSEAWTATKSARAILVIAGIAVGWVVLAWLLRRFLRWVWVRSAILSAIAVAIAVVLIRPYYVDVRDDTTLVTGPVQNASQAAPAAPDAAPAPVGPVRVSSGRLEGIGHSASGEASIIRQPRRQSRRAVLELRHRRQSRPDRVRRAGREPREPGRRNLADCAETSVRTPITPCRRTPSPGRVGPSWCGAAPSRFRSRTPPRPRYDD